MLAYGIGSQVAVLLPYSRQHESEADRIGLILMAKAGYDPREAVSFWQRMAAQSEGQPPEFLSTHPAHDTRIQGIRDAMPEAVAIYESR
jgi:predicted Zn-dependent protease